MDCLIMCNSDNTLYHCISRYVGRTSQQLQDRIRQHVPKFIRTGQIPNSWNTFSRFCKSLTPVMFREFAIGQHFLDNSTVCASNITVIKNFSILLFGGFSFHLSALEAVYILSQPIFSRQKEFVYNLKILRWLHVLTLFLICNHFCSVLVANQLYFFVIPTIIY